MLTQDWLTWSLLLYPLGLVAAIDALWSGRTAQGSLAWMLSLLVIPQLSLPAYLLFGSRRLKGYRRARQRVDGHLTGIGERVEQQLLPYRCNANATIRPLLALFRSPMLTGNKVELLTSGEQTFAALFEALNQAQHSICLQFYIIRDDDLGQRLLSVLQQRAAAGVRIYIVFDEIGSHGLTRHYRRQLRAAGIEFSRFNPIRLRNRMQLNFRNHRKLVVIDEQVAFIGGYNIGDEYLSADWRDTHLRIQGPAALSFQLGFAEDWHWATSRVPDLNWRAAPKAGDQAVMCINPGPADQFESASLFVCQMIQAAQQRCWLVSPYFVPDQAVISNLQLAVLRGVDVRILVPEKTDNRVVQLAMMRYIEELSQAGIRFSTYRAGFLHQKVMLIDEELVSVGSANLDNRSLRINFEMNALMQDRTLAKQVEAMLQQDFLQSTSAQVSTRWHQQLLARLARLLAPLL